MCKRLREEANRKCKKSAAHPDCQNHKTSYCSGHLRAEGTRHKVPPIADIQIWFILHFCIFCLHSDTDGTCQGTVEGVSEALPINCQCCHCENTGGNGEICNKIVQNAKSVSKTPVGIHHVREIRYSIKNYKSQVGAGQVEEKIVRCCSCSSLSCTEREKKKRTSPFIM